MRSLITGANGLIGSHIARELINDKSEVRGLVRQSSDLRSLANLPMDKMVGDVFDKASLAEAMEGCQVVFHTAAHFAYTGERAAQLDALALEGTENVIKAAKQAGVQRVVLSSSSVVCGYNERPLARTELDHLNAKENIPYVLSKDKQERLAFDLALAYGVDLVAACPTMTIGPHDYRLGPSNGALVSYLNDPFRTTFPGGCNMVAVQDVARGHVLLAQQGTPGERYLLGGENIEWCELHAVISELCGMAPPHWQANHTASFLAACSDELVSKLSGRQPLTTRTQAQMVGRYYWYDHSAAAALGYKPSPLRKAVAQAVAWLTASEHIARKVRLGLRLSREVFAAYVPPQNDRLLKSSHSGYESQTT
jgi:dihydroflavonol-4-reductase